MSQERLGVSNARLRSQVRTSHRARHSRRNFTRRRKYTLSSQRACSLGERNREGCAAVQQSHSNVSKTGRTGRTHLKLSGSFLFSFFFVSCRNAWRTRDGRSICIGMCASRSWRTLMTSWFSRLPVYELEKQCSPTGGRGSTVCSSLFLKANRYNGNFFFFPTSFVQLSVWEIARMGCSNA